MTKRLKKLCLVFSLFLALLASPIVSAACVCESQKNASGEHSAHSAAENDCHSHHSQTPSAAKTAGDHCQTASLKNGCCCVGNGKQVPALNERKAFSPDSYHLLLLPAYFDFSVLAQIESIRFDTSKNIYLARSTLADKPSRAPPVL